MKSRCTHTTISLILIITLLITLPSSSTTATPWVFPKKDLAKNSLNETMSGLLSLKERRISYYDQNCQQETSIGLTNGGTFEAAIRITPRELASSEGWQLAAARVFIAHDETTNPQGNLKIYMQGTPMQPGALLTSEPYLVTGGGWLRVNLSKPVLLDTMKDLWVSFEITHTAGTHPMIADEGPACDGKGDWVGHNGSWAELQTIDPTYNLNWVIEAILCNTSISRTALQISTISGGLLGLRTTMTNIGDSNAINITINITIKGGVLPHLTTKSIASIPLLPADRNASASLRLFGLGRIFMTIVVKASNADTVVRPATGILFGPFLFIRK